MTRSLNRWQRRADNGRHLVDDGATLTALSSMTKISAFFSGVGDLARNAVPAAVAPPIVAHS
jgi:hypothetical protein